MAEDHFFRSNKRTSFLLSLKRRQSVWVTHSVREERPLAFSTDLPNKSVAQETYGGGGHLALQPVREGLFRFLETAACLTRRIGRLRMKSKRFGVGLGLSCVVSLLALGGCGT